MKGNDLIISRSIFTKVTSLIGILVLIFAFAGCEQEKSVTYLKWSPTARYIGYIQNNALKTKSLDENLRTIVLEDKHLVGNHFDWDATGRYVIYTSDERGSYDIVAKDVKTMDKIFLVSSPAKDYYPVVDHSSGTLYFLSFRSGMCDIWKKDIRNLSDPAKFADANEIAVTNNEFIESDISVDSKHGRYIAYLSTGFDGKSNLVITDVQKNDTKVLFEKLEDVEDLVFSNGGGQLAIVQSGQIWIIDVNRAFSLEFWYLSQLIQLDLFYKMDKGTHPSWSSNDLLMAYAKDGDIYTCNFGFFRWKTKLTKNPARDDYPRWSSKGNEIAYVTGLLSDEYNLDYGNLLLYVNPLTEKRQWMLETIEEFGEAYEICKQEGSDAEAAELLNAALKNIENIKNKEEVYRKIASTYLTIGRFSEASDIYENKLSDYYEAARIQLFYLKNATKARELFVKSLDNYPSAQIYITRIDTYPTDVLNLWMDIEYLRNTGHYTLATWKIEDFLRRFPQYDIAEKLQFELGDVRYTGLNKPKEALALYEQAIAKYPGSEYVIPAMHNCVKILIAEDNIQKALDYLYTLIVIDRSSFAKLSYYGEALHLTVTRDGNLAQAKRFYEYFKEHPFAEREFLIKFCLDTLFHYDEAGYYDEANTLLVDMMDSFTIETSELSGIVYCLRYADEKPIYQSRLREIPAWLKERVFILLDHTSASILPDEFKEIIKTLFTDTPQRIEELWNAFVESGSAEYDPKYMKNLSIAFNYFLGNMFQSENDVERALYYYDNLAKIMERTVFLKTIKNCQEFLNSNGNYSREEKREILLEWLDIERNSAVDFWGNCLYFMKSISSYNQSITEAEIKNSIRQNYNEQYLNQYVDFQKKYPDIFLQDNVTFRIFSVEVEKVLRLPDTITRTSHLERLARFAMQILTQFPDSEYASEVYNDLIYIYKVRGNYNLAIEKSQDLAAFFEDLTAHNENFSNMDILPRIYYTIGLFYQENLKNTTDAIEYYKKVSDTFTDADIWEDATKRYVELLVSSGNFLTATQKTKEVIQKKPEAEWVRSGYAQLSLANALELSGDWEEAETHYLQFLANYRANPMVADYSVLLSILPKLTDEGLQYVNEHLRMDLVMVWDEIDPWTKEKMTTRLGITAPTQQELNQIQY